MRAACARSSAAFVARPCRGTRTPAASRRFFISDLSRKGIVCATPMPAAPRRSRSFAARIIPGSHKHSTLSGLRPPSQFWMARIVASSSHKSLTGK
jgi:hypothetical protein